MKTITEKTVGKVVKEALSERRLKKIALQAMEDYVFGLSLKEGEKTAIGDYAALRDKKKDKIRKTPQFCPSLSPAPYSSRQGATRRRPLEFFELLLGRFGLLQRRNTL